MTRRLSRFAFTKRKTPAAQATGAFVIDVSGEAYAARGRSSSDVEFSNSAKRPKCSLT